MRIRCTIEDQDGLMKWAEGRLGLDDRFPAHAKALGIVVDDELACVIVYVHTYHSVCDMHVASDGGRRWANRRTLGAIFAFAFAYLGAPRAQALVSVDNAPALRLCDRLGFGRVGVIPEAAEDGSDGVLFTMLARDCRHTKKKGQAHG